MKQFGGKVLFLDRSDINTDEIIPARYLTEISKEALKPHMLEDLNLDGFDPKSSSIMNKRVIISRSNFGCGSSREHAPWVFEVNDINVVIASGFARIFRQNMFNCGMLAIELSEETIEKLFSYNDGSAEITFDFAKDSFIISSGKGRETVSYNMTKFDRALVEAGGWVEFADARY